MEAASQRDSESLDGQREKGRMMEEDFIGGDEIV